MSEGKSREGSLEAPRRLPLEWRTEGFFDPQAIEKELERVFDICHGCRRCFSLCNAFPTLFDAVDASDTGEVDAVPRAVFQQVVDHCYLCDMCFMSKCPYVPPHPWNIDFPHLMLRAKAQRFNEHGARWRDRVLAATDTVGALAGIPVVAEVVNAVNASNAGRALLERTLGVARDAPVPHYHSRTARDELRTLPAVRREFAGEANGTRGRVALFATCYGNRNFPQMCADLAAVFAHNGIELQLVGSERCCGMPRLELGDLESVAAARDANIPALARMVRDGWDIVAPVPSCVLMFRQELPLMFPDDADVALVAAAFFDPFHYLSMRHRAGRLDTRFGASLGKVSYQVPCHLRVQNIGLRTKEILELVPGTEVLAIERCSGHDGTYGVKTRFREASRKIAAPVASRVRDAGAAHFTSDCPMAGEQIAGLSSGAHYTHPLALLRQAYGI